jgi:hypothetical protein
VDLRDPFFQQVFPSIIMLLIKLEPTFLTDRYRHAIAPSRIARRCEIIECFELERFFDRQPDQNAATIFVDAISLGEFVDGKSHVIFNLAAIKVGPSDASNPESPYRVIEIVAVHQPTLARRFDDNAPGKGRNAIPTLT